MQQGEEPGPPVPSINWRRFAIMGSAVITGVAVIRLIADQLGIPRGTRASAVVSSVSNFLMYLVFGLSVPYVMVGVRSRPLLRRLIVLVPFSLLCAIVNYLVLVDDL